MECYLFTFTLCSSLVPWLGLVATQCGPLYLLRHLCSISGWWDLDVVAAAQYEFTAEMPVGTSGTDFGNSLDGKLLPHPAQTGRRSVWQFSVQLGLVWYG